MILQLNSSSVEKEEAGYTMLELLVVIGLILLISTAAFVFFFNTQARNNRNVTAGEIMSAIRKQQSLSMIGEDQSEHGVYFESSRYVEFTGSAYSEGAAGNVEHSLPIGVSISGIDFSGEVFVLFSRLEGEPKNAGQLSVDAGTRGGSALLIINSLGTINIQYVD